jgi:Flp pilus assembly protein protease CpaA
MSLLTDPVFWVELVMLSALLAMGFYLSYTDLKTGRVPNRYTFALLAIGAIGQVAMLSLGATNWSRIAAVLLLGLALAFVLSLIGFWAPGDAKLFWATAVALPPTLCPSFDPFSLQSAPLALVLNALLCYLLVLLLVPLWKKDWKQEKAGDRPGGQQWLQAAWGLGGLLGLVLGFAVLVLERPLSYLEGFAVLLIGYGLLKRGLEAKYWPVILLPGLVGLLYLSQAAGGWREYVLLWGVAWLVEVVYVQVQSWYSRAFVQGVPVSLLQAGAIPYRPLYLKEADHTITQSSVADSELICEAGRPLSEQQVVRLRELAQQGLLPQGERLEVEQAIPFVPFIVVAAALTAFFAGNLVPPLTLLVGWLSG